VVNPQVVDYRWGCFPGEPAARLHIRLVEVLRTRHWRFLVMPTGKGFMQVSLSNN
jgi:hypothetical protein